MSANIEKSPLTEWMEIINGLVFVLHGKEKASDLAARVEVLTERVAEILDGPPIAYTVKEHDNDLVKEVKRTTGLHGINLADPKYWSLNSVYDTLDRLLDSRFDLAAEAEADLGEIMHKGEKVTVKIKVVRGE